MSDLKSAIALVHHGMKNDRVNRASSQEPEKECDCGAAAKAVRDSLNCKVPH
jgi:hypothetical protein